MTEYYCGINDVPKGKRRGTPKECYDSKQVRYYGLEIIPEEVLNMVKDIPVESELIKARLRLRALAEKAKALQRDMAKQKLIINEPAARKGQVNAAKRRRLEIIKSAKNLAKKLKAVNVDIEKLEELKKRKDAVLALENLRLQQESLVKVRDIEKLGKAVIKKSRRTTKKSLKNKLLN